MTCLLLHCRDGLHAADAHSALRAGHARIDAVDDDGDVGDLRAAQHEAQRVPVGEARHAPLHALGLVAAVGLEEIDELAARRFALAHRAPGGNVGPIRQMRRAVRQIAQAVAQQLDRSDDLGDADHRPRPDVAVDQRRHVDLEAIVGGVGRVDAHVVFQPAGAGDRANGRAVDRLLFGQHADAARAAQDRVIAAVDVGERVDFRRQLVERGGEIRLHLGVEIVAHAADAHRADVHAVAEQRLLHVLHDLAHLHGVHEQGVVAGQMRQDADVEEMRSDALDLRGDHPEVGRAFGDLEAGDLLARHDVGLGMAVGAERADPFGQHDVLVDRALGRQILDAAMDMAGADVDVAHGLAFDVDVEVHRLFERDVQRPDGNGVGLGCVDGGHDAPPFAARTLSHSDLVLAALTSVENGISRSSTAASIAGSRNRRRGSGWSRMTSE